VLVVDDSADIRELWRLWLTFWGFSVHEARNGYDAIQKATELQPDLILMDLWMPVVDGVEAMRRQKADSRTSHGAGAGGQRSESCAGQLSGPRRRG
jgi:CheY-like chemotaxis protein